MSRKVILATAIVILLSGIVVVSALANTIYLPIVPQNAPTATPTLTPTPLPQPNVVIIDFNVSSTASKDYIEIVNASSGSIDMTGWWIKANSGERYDFPSGFVLGSGKTVKVVSGSGSSTSSTLYWGLSSPVWLKVGNCAFLKNADGVTIDSACVPPVYISDFNSSLNPENDFLVIRNNTSSTIDMTGWWMKAESESGRYDIPAGFKLGALNSVLVISGIGIDTSAELYIGLPYSLWTVSGNCAYLRYKDGTLLDKACVP